MMRNAAIGVLLLLLAASTAQAEGRRRAVAPPVPVLPVAVADMYDLVVSNQPIAVAAPGVLTNDTLNDGAIASFGAATGMEQTHLGDAATTSRGGHVILDATGGFAYLPPSNFSGSDTFLYVIRNAGGSSTATVTINAPGTGPVDFTVTTPGFAFSVSGLSGENPRITLTRGKSYRFRINTAPDHPFEITNAPAGSVQNNAISSGVLTFTVPAATKDYGYICPLHGFGNAITTTP